MLVTKKMDRDSLTERKAAEKLTLDTELAKLKNFQGWYK